MHLKGSIAFIPAGENLLPHGFLCVDCLETGEWFKS